MQDKSEKEKKYIWRTDDDPPQDPYGGTSSDSQPYDPFAPPKPRRFGLKSEGDGYRGIKPGQPLCDPPPEKIVIPADPPRHRYREPRYGYSYYDDVDTMGCLVWLIACSLFDSDFFDF